MAKKAELKYITPPEPPADTLEGRENQLIGYTYNLVEQRILNGTASSQETVHFLRMGSTKMRRDLQKLEAENELLRSKVEVLESSKNSEGFYKEVLTALSTYRGDSDE